MVNFHWLSAPIFEKGMQRLVGIGFWNSSIFLFWVFQGRELIVFFVFQFGNITHCGWKKSCTTWDVENFANNGRLLISTGAEFLPWTVFYVYICIHLEYMQSSNQKNPQGTLLWRWWNDHGYILWGYPFQKRHMQISQKFYVQHFDSHELVHDLPR